MYIVVQENDRLRMFREFPNLPFQPRADDVMTVRKDPSDPNFDECVKICSVEWREGTGGHFEIVIYAKFFESAGVTIDDWLKAGHWHPMDQFPLHH